MLKVNASNNISEIHSFINTVNKAHEGHNIAITIKGDPRPNDVEIVAQAINGELFITIGVMGDREGAIQYGKCWGIEEDANERLSFFINQLLDWIRQREIIAANQVALEALGF